MLEQLADGASGLVTSVTSGAKQMTDEIAATGDRSIRRRYRDRDLVRDSTAGALAAFCGWGVLLGIDISGPANYLTGRFNSLPSKHNKRVGSPIS